MKILGIEGLTVDQVNDELRNGGKFVTYQYCISIVVMTFKRSSNVYFIKGGESTFLKGFKYTLLSLILGWWGIPWGPIYTITSIVTNCRGGKDVTQEILSASNQSE